MTSHLNLPATVERLRNAAIAVYGETGWQRAVSREFNYPQSQLSKLVTGKLDLTEYTEDKLAGILVRLEQAETNMKRETALAQASLVESIDTEPTTLRGQINERFEMVLAMVKGAVAGRLRFVIVSGPPGLGKSYSTLHELHSTKTDYVALTGAASAIGLYQTLYNGRNGVVLLDDTDKLWNDETALNLLKFATSTDDNSRTITWALRTSGIYQGTDEARLAEIEANTARINEENEKEKPSQSRIDALLNRNDALAGMLPNQFDFKGQVIWITNKDPGAMVADEHKNAEHIAALIDRGFYLPLDMNSTEKKMERVAQAVEEFGILDKKGIDRTTEGAEIVEFMRANAERFQTLSYRTAEKIADLRKTSARWKRIAMVTLFGYSN